jgi:hypothetical protein
MSPATTTDEAKLRSGTDEAKLRSNTKIVVMPKGKRVLCHFIAGYDYVEGGRIHLMNGLSFTAWPPAKGDEFLGFMDEAMTDPGVLVVDLKSHYKKCFPQGWAGPAQTEQSSPPEGTEPAQEVTEQ